jgi:hypothetical protein
MMSVRLAPGLSGAAINDARANRAGRRAVFHAGRTNASLLAAVFEASCFASLNSTGCVFADPSFVDV